MSRHSSIGRLLFVGLLPSLPALSFVFAAGCGSDNAGLLHPPDAGGSALRDLAALPADLADPYAYGSYDFASRRPDIPLWPGDLGGLTPDDGGGVTLSDGGGGVRCIGKMGAKGDPVLNIASGGLSRSTLLHIPSSYDPATPTMLVLNLHGYFSDPIQEAFFTEMNPVADKKSFLVAYPAGIANSWNAGQCCGDAWFNAVDDVAFFRDLIARLTRDYCIDPRRIYATGMSNGGFMSHRLACQLSDQIAAVAPVAGVLGIPPAQCTPKRAVPVMEFHGTADPLVPYKGGVPLIQAMWKGGLDFASVADTVSFWRTHDHCKAGPAVTYQVGDALCQTWSMCDSGSEVTLCTVDNGGHTWPGGLPIPVGKTSTDINATSKMIDFFLAHPMP